MLTVSKPSANRVDITLSGLLDADAMAEALDHLINTCESVSNGKMLYRVIDVEMPTMGAIAAEISRMPKLLGLLAKFDKCALLSDVEWVRAAAEIEGIIIPGLQIKSFVLADVASAEAWLANKMIPEDEDAEAENFPV